MCVSGAGSVEKIGLVFSYSQRSLKQGCKDLGFIGSILSFFRRGFCRA